MITNILKYWQTILVLFAIAAVLSTVAYYVVYQRGYDSCVSKISQNANEQKDKANELKVKNDSKFQSLQISDIDAYGIEHGWVRSYDNR